jgi:rhodanese-related sulfurtransferase
MRPVTMKILRFLRTLPHLLPTGLLVTAAMLSSGGAHAMTLEVKGNTLFATGVINDDFAQFEAALKNRAIKTLVLANSPGGAIYTAVKVGDLVEDRKLNTVVAGYCVSACTLIFVRGVNRSFSGVWPPSQTYLGIHGPHEHETKKLAPDFAHRLFDYYKHWLNNKFNETVFKTALYDMEDAGAMLKIYDPHRSPSEHPEHCPSQFKPGNSCTYFRDQDAFSLGLVTQKELVDIDLPESLKPRTEVLGISLNQPQEHDFLTRAQTSYCTHPACKEALDQFAAAKPTSALAFASNAVYASYVEEKDSPTEAFASAMSACNFPSPTVTQLCEGQIVNGLDIRGLYREEAAQHKKGINNLEIPSKRYYASEASGGTFSYDGRLKTTAWFSPTPSGLPGIATIHTQALAEMIKSASPPQLIALASFQGQTLTSARLFEQGGIAFDVPVVERELEARFARMMRLLAPKTDQALVLYCLGPDSWFSVNAALRAKKMGYQRVYWYRGGLAAWTEAKLPTVIQLPRAVLAIH